MSDALVVGKISGGTGSWSAVRRYVDRHGSGHLALVFTDTLCEDQDAYRFLIAGAANLFGVELPAGFLPALEAFPAWEDRQAYKDYVRALAARSAALLPGLHWISDGRDPWDVFEAERFMGNTRIDPCSKILKRKLSDRWMREHCDPSTTAIIFGIDNEEQHRFDDGKGGGIAPRRWADGWLALAPLCERPFRSWQGRLAELERHGLWLPRLNQVGFAHNNCGGFCCKAGQGHWKHMLRTFPERYTYAEAREEAFRKDFGFGQAMLRDRRGGTTKPLPLSVLRSRELRPDEAAEMGGCNCFTGDAA